MLSNRLMPSRTPTESKPARFKCWVLRLNVVLACVLVPVVVGVLVPQDLSDIDGYGVDSGTAKARDLEMVLTKSIANGHEVALSEGEINRWLAKELGFAQNGVFAGVVRDGRLWVRLGDGVAELVLERRVFGLRMTWSMFVQVHQKQLTDRIHKEVLLHGGPYVSGVPAVRRGGRFGRVVLPQGYLHFVLAEFGRLAAGFPDEIRLALEEMSSVRILEGKLVLNPRQSHLEEVIRD